MKKKVSFNLDESIYLVENYINTSFYKLLKESIYYESELNENDKRTLDIIDIKVREYGWYPFVSYVNENKVIDKNVWKLTLDEDILYTKLLLKELPLIKEWNKNCDEYNDLLHIEKELLRIKDNL